MIILKILGILLAGVYGLYLATGLIILLPEILWAVGTLLGAPHKLKKDPKGCGLQPQTFWALLKEVPEFSKDCLVASAKWIAFPFILVFYLIFQSKIFEAETGDAG